MGELPCKGRTISLQDRMQAPWNWRLLRSAVLVLGSLAASAAERQPLFAQAITLVEPVQPKLLRAYVASPDGLQLFNVKAVAVERSTGALWVLAGKGDPPIVFARDGSTSRVVNRIGSGPGEFQRPSALASSPLGGMGVLDFPRRRWMWLDPSGRELSSWTVPKAIVSRPVFVDGGANVHFAAFRPYSDAEPRTTIVNVSQTGALIDTVVVPLEPHPDAVWKYHAVGMTSGTNPQPAEGGATMPVPFEPAVLWGMDASGRQFFARGDSNSVNLMTGSGLRRLFIPQYADQLTTTERSLLRKKLNEFEKSPSQMPANYPKGAWVRPRPVVPRLHPEIDALIAVMGGGIAVVRSVPCAALPWKKYNSREADLGARCPVVERFDADLNRLQPFALEPADTLRVVRGDTVWVVRTDSDGLSKVLEMVVGRRRP